MAKSPAFPEVEIGLQHTGIHAALATIASAVTTYDNAYTAWTQAGSLSSGSEYDAVIAASGSLVSARDAGATDVANVAVCASSYAGINSEDVGSINRALAYQLALALLPNGASLLP